ncbi:MAG: WYL domain-containing protein [Oscillospiraceae bacterium]|nr:WYL domain-containing protein [Oscillospiraceae bacterium]
MPSNRLFEILYLLLERKQVTAAGLAERFGVSVRTIYRDIDALSSAGVPVFATQGRGGGIALMDHYVLDRAAFSEEEQRQLLTALQSLPGPARSQAEETLTKLSALFRRSEPDWLQVDLSRWGQAGPDRQKFDLLRNAILDRRVMECAYAGSCGQLTRRRVLPARLVFKGQSWYLQGWCLSRADYRTFKVSRMLSLSDTGEHFDRALDPPPIEGASFSEAFCVPVRLRFAPWMAYRVYDEFDEGCVQREADGALTVSVLFPEDQWLYGYLLSFGTAVEVLEPAALKGRLALLAKKIWQAHSEPDAGCQVCCGIMGASQPKEGPTMDFKNMTFCQSCGMPLTGEDTCGTEQDGSLSPHYCKYCYQNGAFTGDMTMEQMIDFCTPMMVQGNPGMTGEQAREQMHQFFPMLMRWKK